MKKYLKYCNNVIVTWFLEIASYLKSTVKLFSYRWIGFLMEMLN